MPDDNKLRIKLHMYDIDMPVTINREDEPFYRRAGKLVDQRVNLYAKSWKDKKNDKEILYMALVDIALRYEKESSHNDTAPYSDILAKLTSEIEEALKE
jgi:cell division protein ZapA